MQLFITRRINDILESMSPENLKVMAEQLFSFSKPLLRVMETNKETTVRYPSPIGLIIYDQVKDAEKDARQFIRVMVGYAEHAKYTADSVAVFKGPVSRVTQCQVFRLKEPVGKTRALARVQLNDEVQLTGLKVMDGTNGLFVAYPNDPGYKGDDFRSLFYPTTRELREHIEETVLIKYRDSLEAVVPTKETTPKKRGRPTKEKATVPAAPKKRGRPAKMVVAPVTVKKRGRPAKKK